MSTNLNVPSGIQDEIERLNTAKDSLNIYLEDNGVNVSSSTKLDGMVGLLSEIETGGGGDFDALVERNLSVVSGNASVIGNYAFYYNTNLTTASFPNCTSIGSNAFGYCSNLTSVSFPECSYIGSYAFNGCRSLTTASFPACTNIGSYVFGYCYSLTTANFPNCTSIGSYAFNYCSNLRTVSFPACTSIGTSAFGYCSSLTTASFPNCTSIGSSAFNGCLNLKSLYLMGSSIPPLINSMVFRSTPIGGYSTSAGTYGSIYVPASLLTQYQSASYWSYFSSRFVGV